jgi:mono/diheme cytochrome c family protein
MKRLVLVAALLAASAASADGKATYTSKCVACHGADGKGQSAMAKKLGVKDLTVSKLGAGEMEAVITKGKGKMTPFGGKLSPAEIKDVAAYVKGALK